ncbi:MAG: phenylalanine--tRNA ligase subunit alpha [Chlamydiia bacterium]|nr:phenylalanine--tRNA ligase subunit alpha [Chlamydiia bacterium]
MKQKIQDLKDAFQSEIQNIIKAKDLEPLRIKYLGKKSPIQALMQGLKDCSPEVRPEMGQLINTLKSEVTTLLEEARKTLEHRELSARLKEETIDVTLPGKKLRQGALHPLTQMLDEVAQILIGMGFSIQESPELESEYYNYGGLNYPPDHPARDMQDTFYITPDLLLRSHTTSIQQRMMEQHAPPIRIAAPGKCYRNETITSRSHVFFHQVDVLYIDKGVTFSDLLATKEEFYSKIFKQKVHLRVRPSYFPFVEPGMEVDIRCTACAGSGCPLCKQTGWLEVAGAGMVHPNVLKEGGIDLKVYSGYAWGGGIERLFMLKHGISDIRLFTENNLEFLHQFK